MSITLFSSIVALTLVLAAIAGLWAWALNSPFRITPEAARILLQAKKVDLLLDVRTQLERERFGVAEGSVHIPAADLEREIYNRYPDRKMLIIAYCNTGQRARAATEKLHRLGYPNALYITAPHTTLATAAA